MRNVQRAAVVGLLLVVMSAWGLAFGQPARLPGGQGLMAYAPRDTVFFLERRGHLAVKKAFDASNLGKMAKDDAVNDFVHGSRVKIGELIVKEIFSLKNPVEIQAHQKTLHELLKAFWYQPSAVFVTASKSGPEFVFICRTGDYQKECRQALDKLMSVGLPPGGVSGTRQTFEYKSSGVSWKGVAKGWREFQLDNDPAKLPAALEGKTVFMAAWQGKMLCVAMSLPAADRASPLLAKGDPGKSILANESVHVVAAKTNIKDWAFRWQVNPEPLFEMMGDEMADGTEPAKTLAVLGIDRIRGAGGVGGYLDNVYTRITYVDAPNTGGLFKRGGDYKKALAMTPDGAAVFLAGQFDTQWIAGAVSSLMGANQPKPPSGRNIPENPVFTQIKALLANSNGNGSIFLTSLPALMAGMMGGGPPVGFVMDIKDQAKAAKALEALAKLTGAPADQPATAKPYRKIKIVPMGGALKAAVTKDRLIITLGQIAMTAAIDTALDDTGALAADSKGGKLLKLAGDGSAVFQMDLAEMVKMVWPLLIASTEQDAKYGRAPSFPLASIPSTGKMARMLGPEIAVLKPDKGGLLMKSRGKIPFVTKIIPVFSMVSGIPMLFMMAR